MATANTELMLVQRFHSLSQNYDTRPAIARRNTLPTLSRFLTNKEREIRKLALEAVYLLSQHPENVELLANEQPITEGVFAIYKEAQYDDPQLHELSSNTLDCLSVAMPDGDPRRGEVLRRAAESGRIGADTDGSQSRASSMSYRRSAERDDDGAHHCNSNRHNYNNNGGSDSDEGPPLSIGPSTGTTSMGNQSSHVVTLDIPAVNARADTSDLESILQKTKGVLSYTVSASAHQVRVFMAGRALKPLQDALNAAGYVNLVVSDDRIVRESSVASVAGNYYDDEYSEEKQPSYIQSARSFASSLYSAVITYTGTQNNSLSSRVQRQRELEQNQGNQAADRVAKAFANWW